MYTALLNIKTYNFKFLLFYFFIHNINLYAQGNCEVKLKSVQGAYSGECSNNLAMGRGKSIGIDTYEGQFKDGYPDGRGMYTWNDGHYFLGNFIKGKKTGGGEMFFESVSGADSVITGFWDKDNFIGRFAFPFKVISYSSRINRVECMLRSKSGRNISITAKHRGGPTGINSTQTPSYITEILIISGSFKKETDPPVNYASLKILEDVIFPFEAIFYLNNGENTKVLINEKGSYEIFIDMN